MAQTKQSTGKAKNTKSNNTSEKAKKAVMRVVKGIILMLIGIFSFLCMISDSMGAIGKWTALILFGLTGNAAYIIAFVLVFFGVLLVLKETHRTIRVKAVASFFTIISLSAFINNFTSNVGYTENVFNAISDYYITGQAGTSGGVLGGLVSSWMSYAVGLSASNVILIIVLIIASMVITGISPLALYRFYKNRELKKQQRDKEDQEEYKRRALIQIEKEKLLAEQQDLKALNDGKKKINIDIPLDEKDLKKSQNLIFDKQMQEIKEKPVLDDKLLEVLNKPSQPEKNKEEQEIEKVQAETLKKTNSTYIYPPLTLLKKDTSNENIDVSDELRANAAKLVETLKSFGVETKIVAVSRGPSVTRYELSPSTGVKVSKIVNLADDIALNMASSGVRIEAPIPGKAAVGIEVPNRNTSSVYLRDILSSGEFIKSKSNLSFALGKDVSGNVMVGDISKMPHMLIAGATGSGKSVCINTIITSILYKSTPDEVKLLMVDPKVVELGVYNGIPHLLIPVVTDPKKAAGALRWAVSEMLNRYKLFAENNVRDLKGYNDVIKQKNEENTKPLPEVVIIIDELADLMMAAPNEVEDAICRLAQMARAAGMHLVIATQRPSVDVITGVIKANIPSRISFAVSSQVDSRTILDMGGAEKLLGKGDMLYSPIGSNKPTRIQGCFVSDKEVEAVVEFIKQSQQAVDYDKEIIDNIEKESIIGVKGAKGNSNSDNSGDADADEMLFAAIEVVVENEMASVSLLQRKLKLGYARAARIIDQMEERGIVGQYEGSKPRKVMITKNQFMEMKLAREE